MRIYVIGNDGITLCREPLATVTEGEIADRRTSRAPLRQLDRIIDGDRYFLSPRIQMLRAIREQLKPYPAVQPAASRAQRIHEPPSMGQYRRRR
jgi:hypothetical protein